MGRVRPVVTLLVATLLVVAPLGALPLAAGLASTNGTGSLESTEAVDGQMGVTSVEQSSEATASQPVADNEIRQNTTLFQTPEKPGSIRVEFRYTLPDYLSKLTVRVSPRATVLQLDGFEQNGTATFEWDGETTNPTVVFRLPANRTDAGARGDARVETLSVTRDGTAKSVERRSVRDGRHRAVTGQTAESEYLFIDTGPWALVEQPGYDVGWSYPSDEQAPTFSERVGVDGPGAAGDEIAFLGEQRTYTRTVNGQTFELVVPKAADLTVAPESILDSLGNASRELTVGDKDERVFFVAAPTGIDYAVQGLQTGDSDAWVRADKRLRSAGNVWFHEYVHTRQDFEPTNQTKWITEGSADYYAALLSLRFGLIDFDEFADLLRSGTRDRYADVVLSDRSTWTDLAQYQKGALVAGELDRQIRVASDRSATFQTVFSRANADTDELTAAEFESFVADGGSDTTADAAVKFTRTDATPSVWSRTQHTTAFGTEPARIEVSVASVDVAGPYRNRTVDSLTLVPNETLSIRTLVANSGGESGDYRVVVGIDEESISTRTGTLQPETTVNETVAYTFTETGRYTLSVNGANATVTVREPAKTQVSGLSLNRTTLGSGDAVRATVTVENTADRPATDSIPITLDGETVATRTVRLDARSTTTVSVVVRVSGSGSHTLAAGEREQTVQVETPTPTPSPTASPTATATPTESVGDSPTATTAPNAGTAGDTTADDGTAGGDGPDGSDDGDTSQTGTPGFGALVALLAVLVSAALGAVRR